jgi:hypothetical protein
MCAKAEKTPPALARIAIPASIYKLALTHIASDIEGWLSRIPLMLVCLNLISISIVTKCHHELEYFLQLYEVNLKGQTVSDYLRNCIRVALRCNTTVRDIALELILACGHAINNLPSHSNRSKWDRRLFFFWNCLHQLQELLFNYSQIYNDEKRWAGAPWP